MSDKYIRTEKEQFLNRIGREPGWGWSPAVDFIKLLEKHAALRSPHHQSHVNNTTSTTTDTKNEAEVDKTPINHTTDGLVSSSFSTLPNCDKTREKAILNENDLNELISKIQTQGRSQTANNSPGDGVGMLTADNNAAATDDTPSCEPVSILLAGAADIRHIFRTLATLRLREVQNADDKAITPMYHIYLYEPSLRIHCRHLFFIQWFLDSMFSLEELEERVLMFLEIFGNSLMRDITAAQLRNVAQHLLGSLEMETGPLSNMVNFSEMKHKEKDFIENQLRNWGKDSTQADIAAQWSMLLRQDMAERYDNRDNLIDWDFVFNLKDYTHFLKFPEYRVWRNTGVAYDVCHINPRRGFEYDYTVPNKTLCLFDRHGRGVYRGDISSGPFFSFGSLTENKFLHNRSADGTCKYGNGVVSMHNVRAWLYTFLTGSAWPWVEHAFAWDNSKNYNYLPPNIPSSIAYQAVFPRVRFHFIGLDFNRFILHQAEGRIPRMHAAFFGTSCTQLLTQSFLNSVMHDSGVVVMETVKFVVDVNDTTKEAFVQKIKDMAESGNWQQDDKLTAFLHECQPELEATKGEPTTAQLLSSSRYTSPFQISLTKKEVVMS
ncbi:unnamed protein product [Phytomonas sp. Hart1]|nr:unnamed protein product [Phytomonas sp. Hart1]|eukprot:CCW71118.1 unnamed protein product [Phytomonas sp. isolate Hart1]